VFCLYYTIHLDICQYFNLKKFAILNFLRLLEVKMPIIETRRRGLFGLGRETRTIMETNSWSQGGERGGAWWPPIFRQIPEEPVKSLTIENQVTIVVLQAVVMFVVAFAAITLVEVAAWLWGDARFNLIFGVTLLLLLWMIGFSLRLYLANWHLRDLDRERLITDVIFILLSVLLLWLLDCLAATQMTWYRRLAAMLAINLLFALGASGPWLWRRMRREVDDPSWNPGPLARAAIEWVELLKPQPPPQPVIYRLEITNDNGLQRQIVYEDLPPGVDFGLLATFVQGARTRGTAREAWINPGGGKPRLTREQYEAVKELLFRHGWAREVTPGVPQHGWVISQRADVLLERLRDWRDTGHPPTPEPLAVVGTEDVANQPTASQRPEVNITDADEDDGKED
jgi:hypothetical protein